MSSTTLDKQGLDEAELAAKRLRVKNELQRFFNDCLNSRGGRSATATAEVKRVAAGVGLTEEDLNTTQEASTVVEAVQAESPQLDIETLAQMGEEDLDAALEEDLNSVEVLPQGREIFKRLMSKMLQVVRDPAIVEDPEVFEYISDVIKTVRRILKDKKITGEESIELAELNSGVSQIPAKFTKVRVSSKTLAALKNI